MHKLAWLPTVRAPPATDQLKLHTLAARMCGQSVRAAQSARGRTAPSRKTMTSAFTHLTAIAHATVEIPIQAQIPATIVRPDRPIPHDGTMPRQIEPVE